MIECIPAAASRYASRNLCEFSDHDVPPDSEHSTMKAGHWMSFPDARWPAVAIGPPPGTRPAPTSHCDRIAFSRLARRMSLASASSLPTPVARPRIEAMDATGARLRRASMSGSARHRRGDLHYRLPAVRHLGRLQGSRADPSGNPNRHGSNQRKPLR